MLLSTAKRTTVAQYHARCPVHSHTAPTNCCQARRLQRVDYNAQGGCMRVKRVRLAPSQGRGRGGVSGYCEVVCGGGRRDNAPAGTATGTNRLCFFADRPTATTRGVGKTQQPTHTHLIPFARAHTPSTCPRHGVATKIPTVPRHRSYTGCTTLFAVCVHTSSCSNKRVAYSCSKQAPCSHSSPSPRPTAS